MYVVRVDFPGLDFSSDFMAFASLPEAQQRLQLGELMMIDSWATGAFLFEAPGVDDPAAAVAQAQRGEAILMDEDTKLRTANDPQGQIVFLPLKPRPL